MAKGKPKEEKAVRPVEPEILRGRMTFLREMLSTKPKSEDLHEIWIVRKAAALARAKKGRAVDDDKLAREQEVAHQTEEEIADELREASQCVFHRGPAGNPIVWDYQLCGFFKETCNALRRAKLGRSANLAAYEKVINLQIFVEPEQLDLVLPAGKETSNCIRPLRVTTRFPEQSVIACSEQVPRGTTMEFEVHAYGAGLIECVREWLDYGVHHGMGQWRNSGKGKFTWEELGA